MKAFVPTAATQGLGLLLLVRMCSQSLTAHLTQSPICMNDSYNTVSQCKKLAGVSSLLEAGVLYVVCSYRGPRPCLILRTAELSHLLMDRKQEVGRGAGLRFILTDVLQGHSEGPASASQSKASNWWPSAHLHYSSPRGHFVSARYSF